MFFVFSILLMHLQWIAVTSDGLNSCGTFSPPEGASYWQSLGQCLPCTSSEACGFCTSTLQCLPGTQLGPFDDVPCPEWHYESSSCPAIPNCQAYTNCQSCAAIDQCAWCASDNLCLTYAEAFDHDCRGLIFDPPCPVSYVAENTIVGNLVIVPDPNFGGGRINISGSGLSEEGENVVFSLQLNPDAFEVASAGDISLAAGDSSLFNGIGGNITLIAGTGESLQGGSGGSILMEAGDGFGQERYGSKIGNGGDVSVLAGNSVQGSGGEILLQAGNSLYGTGGNIKVTSGSSLSGSSGEISLVSSASAASCSGDIRIASGSAFSESGGLTLSTGDSVGMVGGIHLKSGDSENFEGGAIVIKAGNSQIATGGLVSILSGLSETSGAKIGRAHV